ncbi:MAG TPA: hypothetical protein VLJ57_24945 [Burkholderiaceae bacterium]|nr:hypothetical protein [Burkholderiaceae bacterium]
MKTKNALRLFVFAFLVSLVAACGGGGSDGSAAGGSATVLDSFGRVVPPGDASGVGGDGDAAGADGTAGDGAPIVGGAVVITDAGGKTANATTDSSGYYRANVTGFTPPFVVRVTRTDGTVRRAPSVTPLKKGGFITINISGITDKIASDVAIAGGLSGSSQLTPAVVSAHASSIGTSLAALRTALTSVIVTAGIAAASYDPLITPFLADHTGYDFVLDNTVITVAPGGGTSVSIEPGFQPSVPAYAGTYTGTFAGDDQGTFTVTINSSGFISGTATSQTFGTESITGQVASGGSANFGGSSSSDGTFSGSISPEGVFSGTWSDVEVNHNGTFIGTRQ